MKALLLTGCVLYLFGLTAPTQAMDGDCRGILQPKRLGGDQVLVLAAAGTLFSETRPLADRVLGRDWTNMDPGQIADMVPPDSLRIGVEDFCSWLKSLPGQERGQCRWAIEEWVESYHTVEVLLWLLDVETLGSAVPHLPDTQFLFPRSPSGIAAQGVTVGESLAAGENTGLWYGLASYLAAKEQEERGRIVGELLRLGRNDIDMKR